MLDDDIFVTKKCAVCGRENEYYKKEELQRQLEYLAPDGVGAKAFYMLWHNVIEECPDCNYVAEDISITNNTAKNLVITKEYKDIISNDIIDDISEFEDCEAYKYDAYGFLNKAYGKNYNSATGYLRAFFDTLQGANSWFKEVGGFEDNDPEEKAIYDSAVSLSKNYLEKAKLQLMEILKQRPDNIETLFLLIYTFYYLEDKKRAYALAKKLSEMKLSDIQEKILKYLTTLVVYDRFDWE